MKTYNNWTPVVKSLLNILVKEYNFELYKVNDGGDEDEFIVGNNNDEKINLATNLISGVDSAELFIKHPDYPKETLWLLIVLGNEPFETVADYTCFSLLEEAIDKFSEEWEGKDCPKVNAEDYKRLLYNNPPTLEELVHSYVNGNITHVKDQMRIYSISLGDLLETYIDVEIPSQDNIVLFVKRLS
jgi:hypothetical protein